MPQAFRRVAVSHLVLAAGLFATASVPLACSSAGIAIREKLGYAKREQLTARVQDTRDSQEAAKKQFESALAEFMAVTGAQGGDL